MWPKYVHECRVLQLFGGVCECLGIEDKGNPFDLTISTTVTQSGFDSKTMHSCAISYARGLDIGFSVFGFFGFFGLTNETEQ